MARKQAGGLPGPQESAVARTRKEQWLYERLRQQKQQGKQRQRTARYAAKMAANRKGIDHTGICDCGVCAVCMELQAFLDDPATNREWSRLFRREAMLGKGLARERSLRAYSLPSTITESSMRFGRSMPGSAAKPPHR